MRFSIALLCIFVAVLAIAFGRIYQRLFDLPVPEEFPKNSVWQYKLVGFSNGLAKDLAYMTTLIGIGDNYHSNLASLLAFISSLFKNDIYSDSLEISDTEIFGVGVRIYKHVNKTNQDDEDGKSGLLPAIIYFHGGGWTYGSLDVYDDFCRELAVSSQIIVVSANYRQAPHYIYPTQFNDCYNVAIGVLNTGATYGIDVSRVGIMGDSAGGNLAAAVSHYIASVSEMHCRTQYLKAQILVYPSLQFLDFNLLSFVQNAGSNILSREDQAEHVSLYLNGSTDLKEILLSGNHSHHLQGTEYMSFINKSKTAVIQDDSSKELSSSALEALTHFKGSPLMAKDFKGIPQTFVLTAKFDVVKDEGFLYSERLRTAGVQVKYKNYDSFHGFVTAATEGSSARTDEGDEAIADIVQYIKERV
ncbi:arylacetamide deacetylase-like [Montipora foliosa]|uniref:arylacetamide deacetylase-like n=1 Tax=Montipora foliosa TaxID=591990 RepID=UPI0035F20272